MNDFTSKVTSRLAAGPGWRKNAYAMSAAFTVYFCMYAFRKPFAAASFEDIWIFSPALGLKTALVISQIVGYTISKFLGTRFLPELPRKRRSAALVGLVTTSWIALLVFAIAGPKAKMFCLFANGLCLGMVWGLVLAPLEGRRASEVLLAGLSCSYILASGVVKDVGRGLMRQVSVSESWMPFVTGALFFPLFLAGVWMLSAVPLPTEQDRIERSERVQMSSQVQREFLRRFAVPLVLLVVCYFFLTAFRDYRDNYGVELFEAFGYESEPTLFTMTELHVALGVLLSLSLLSRVRDNRRSLKFVFALMVAGLMLLSGATLLFQAGVLSGLSWMVLTGFGSYLAYVPYGSVLFERIVAHTRFAGTAIFGIYLSDAFGYSGSVALQLYSDLSGASASRVEFFFTFTHILAWGGTLVLVASCYFWLRRGEAVSR